MPSSLRRLIAARKTEGFQAYVVSVVSTGGALKLIAIAGGTASGKSTISKRLVETLGDQAAHLKHDWYYKPTPGGDARVLNHDHPDVLETRLLVTHLDALRRGETIHAPHYDFAICTRHPGKVIPPRPIIVVEGILLLADAALREQFDLKVFMTAPDDIRLGRRILRDVNKRGQTLEAVITKYTATVRPMHEQFVVPSAAHAHLTLDGTTPVEGHVQSILNHLGG